MKKHYTKEEPLRCKHRPTSTGNFNPEPEMQELIAETAIESMLNSFFTLRSFFLFNSDSYAGGPLEEH